MDEQLKKNLILFGKTIFVIFTIIMYFQMTATLGKGYEIFNNPSPLSFSTLYQNLILVPMANILEYFKSIFGSYGWGIVALTLGVNIIGTPIYGYAEYRRILAEPLQKKMSDQREIINKKYEGKTDQESQKLKNQEIMKITNENGGVFGAMGGCFPQIMVMSFSFLFLSSIFFLTSKYEPLRGEQFLWMKLGQTDFIMIALLVVGSLVSAFFMQPKDQRNLQSQQFKTMALMNVSIYVIFAALNNAAFALYSLTNLLVMLLRTNLIRAYIRARHIQEPQITLEANVTKITKKYK